MEKKVTGELVLMWKEDGKPIAFLYENGTREIYTCKRARKEDVAQLLGVDVVHETLNPTTK